MLTTARALNILEAYPWQWMTAGILIVLTVLVTNFLGDGLRRAGRHHAVQLMGLIPHHHMHRPNLPLNDEETARIASILKTTHLMN